MINSFLIFDLLAILAGSSQGVDTKSLFDNEIKPSIFSLLQKPCPKKDIAVLIKIIC